jgi:hypothetical protein
MTLRRPTLISARTQKNGVRSCYLQISNVLFVFLRLVKFYNIKTLRSAVTDEFSFLPPYLEPENNLPWWYFSTWS